jgi:hypothetical protein
MRAISCLAQAALVIVIALAAVIAASLLFDRLMDQPSEPSDAILAAAK